MLHILVEGSFDRELVKRLLADLDQSYNFRVQTVQGRNAGRPIARKCLLIHREPIVFIIDADTSDAHEVQQYQRDLEDYLSWGGHGVNYKVIQFVPELEVIFFEKPGPLERLLGHPLDEHQKVAGRFAPREVLKGLHKELGIVDRADIPNNLKQDDLNEFRSHTTITELREFVKSNAHSEQTHTKTS